MNNRISDSGFHALMASLFSNCANGELVERMQAAFLAERQEVERLRLFLGDLAHGHDRPQPPTPFDDGANIDVDGMFDAGHDHADWVTAGMAFRVLNGKETGDA